MYWTTDGDDTNVRRGNGCGNKNVPTPNFSKKNHDLQDGSGGETVRIIIIPNLTNNIFLSHIYMYFTGMSVRTVL